MNEYWNIIYNELSYKFLSLLYQLPTLMSLILISNSKLFKSSLYKKYEFKFLLYL